MAGKLKGFNFKQLMLKHGEKLMLGGVGLLVLFAMMGTKWIPFNRHPREITNEVKKAEHKLSNKTWPAEAQQEFAVAEEDSVQQLVKLIREPVDSSPFEFSQSFMFDLYGTTTPITEPELCPVESLIADAGRVSILVTPEMQTPDWFADETDGEDGEGDALASQDEKKEDEIPDEFKSRTSGPASLTGNYGRNGQLGSELGEMASGARRFNRDDDRGGRGRSADRGRGDFRGRGNGGSGKGRDDRGGGSGLNSSLLGLLKGTGDIPGGSLPGLMMGLDEGDGDILDSIGMGGGYGGGESRGQRFVSVRGVLPLREQIRNYQKAANVSSYYEAEQLFQIINFELQRKKYLKDAEDPWSGDWQPLDIEVSKDVLRDAVSFDAEPLEGMVMDSAITMPLPMRAQGYWGKLATHPELKNFELDDSEIALELEFQQRLLEEHKKFQESLPEELVQKGGFSDLIYDSRSLTTSFRGGGMALSGRGARTADDDEDYAGGGSGFGRMGYGAGGLGGRSGGYGVANAFQRQIDAQEFLEKIEAAGTDEEETKILKEYITKQIKDIGATGEMLLFRYLDFDVEPGATYKYRVRLEVTNPNYDRPSSAAAGITEVVTGQTRKTEWSNLTESVTVPYDVDYFVDEITTRGTDRLVANWTLFQWDPEFGTTVAKRDVEVELGQEIGGTSKPFVLDPAIPRFEIEDYEFQSGDVFVDAKHVTSIDPGDHPDLQLPPSAKRRDLRISNQTLIVRGNGELRIIDQLSQKDDLKQRATLLGYEQKAYEDIKGAETQQMESYATDELEDLMGFGGLDQMRVPDTESRRGRDRGRRRNNLRITDPRNAPPGEGT